MIVTLLLINLHELIIFIQMGRFENNVVPTWSPDSASQQLDLSFLTIRSPRIHYIRIFGTTGVTLKSQPCVRSNLLILCFPDCLPSRQLVLPQAGDMSVLKLVCTALTERENRLRGASQRAETTETREVLCAGCHLI